MTPQDMSFRDKSTLCIAQLWLAGRCPGGPGTCGAAVAALLAPFLFMPLPFWLRCVVLVAIFFIGAWVTGRAEVLLGRKDPGSIVVDELLGQWLTLLPFATVSPLELAAAFILFRLFDIAKPWPVKAAETWLPGGYGIMIDDVVAGIEAMIVLAVLMGLTFW